MVALCGLWLETRFDCGNEMNRKTDTVLIFTLNTMAERFRKVKHTWPEELHDALEIVCQSVQQAADRIGEHQTTIMKHVAALGLIATADKTETREDLIQTALDALDWTLVDGKIKVNK
jgi:hypothetical protein